MVLPRKLAMINRAFTNRVLGRMAGRMPPFAIIVHEGRRSGRRLRTPVVVFRTEDGYGVALTYGRDSDWVKNVVKAGSCDIITRGSTVHAIEPRIVRDPRRRQVPSPVRIVLSLVGADDFLHLTGKRR